MLRVCLCLGFLSLLPACCKTACRDENLPEYKDRASPRRTAQLFRYAIRNGCDRVAYDCFTRESQEEVSYWKFSWLFCTVELPGTDIDICDWVRDLSIDDEWVDGLKGYVFVIGLDAPLGIVLLEEDGEWKIDLRETLETD